MKITRILSTLTAAVLAVTCNTATAATGDLDLTFGGTGKVTTVVSSSFESGQSVAIQGDGKIVVAGTVGNDNGFALVRYNSGGSVDTSLNGTGRVDRRAHV